MIKSIKRKLSHVYFQEELFWKLKSTNQWLSEGDQNTKFFHRCAKARKLKSRIVSITDSDGIEHITEESISKVDVDYFDDLFTSSSSANWEDFYDGCLSPITQEMNDNLTTEVSTEEVIQAIKPIGGDCAPGPDGLPGSFYQQFITTVGSDIINVIKDFFNNGILSPELNKTNICLVPKIEHPTSMSNYRPISLCNVSYKIISKILIWRLKPILPSIISDQQTAFILGRHITDNVLIAHELLHSLKSRKRQSKTYMAIKTDISKAYDRME